MYIVVLIMYTHKSLLLKKDAPVYTIEPCILSGYRPNGTYMYCLCSMFSLHNQTINIWTSVFLFVYNILLTLHFIHHIEVNGYKAIFFLSQGYIRAYCWFNSWAYHTFACHSKKIANRLCIMDYIGCYLTPFGIGMNLMVAEFYCFSFYRNVFISFGTFFTILAIILALSPKYQTESYRSLRFICSIFSTIPWLIGFITSIYIVHEGTLPVYYFYLLYAMLTECLAGFFYITMVPECIYPIYFDLILPSHSIWHLLNIVFDTLVMIVSYEAYINLINRNSCIL